MAPTTPTRPSAGLGVAFIRSLRRGGLDVSTSSTIDFVNALAHIGLNERSHVYWSGRATLVRRPEDIPVYDTIFDEFWSGQAPPSDAAAVEEHLTLEIDTGDDGNGDGTDSQQDDPALELRFSAVEVLREKDFSEWSDAELEESRRLMSRLRLVGEARRSLRLTVSPNGGEHLDIRRTVRQALATEGEPIRLHRRRRTQRPRRLVLLLDVSGSMEPYARALIRFAHAAVIGRQRVEVFALGTRLTRITRELARRDVDDAIRRAAAAVTDWSGGTRLGEGLRRFNHEWGQRGMARGAIVVILSDGWDRGEPEVLGEQMERLHRFTHRLVWVNPLKVSPGYAPLARGMAAALPHVDDFVEGHNLLALEELVSVIAGMSPVRSRMRNDR